MNDSYVELIKEINKLKKENNNLRNRVEELEAELEERDERITVASEMIYTLKNEIKNKSDIIDGQLKQLEILKTLMSIIH